MNTYPLLTEDNLVYAFEVDNIYISSRTIAKILNHVDGVTNISCRKLFQFSRNDIISFEYSGFGYVVVEPFGDNSGYWVGPKDDSEKVKDISSLITMFSNYKLNYFLKFIGDVLSLKFSELGKPS